MAPRATFALNYESYFFRVPFMVLSYYFLTWAPVLKYESIINCTKNRDGYNYHYFEPIDEE